MRWSSLLLLALSACSRAAPPVTPPSALCGAGSDRARCLDPRDAEQRLRRADLEILNSSDAPGGKQDAKVLTLRARDGDGRIVFRAKWRANSTGHSLNRPRHEVTAFALAKLVLEPEQNPIPPTSGHCFELAEYRAHVDENAEPSFGLSCVFGVLAYWLEDAHGIDDAEDEDLVDESEPLDEELFWQSATYRRSIANVNLLSYLVANGDSHSGQFVVTGSASAPRVHLVDNTIAFSSYRNPSIPSDESWASLRVPALSAESVQRLARVAPHDFDSLAVVEQYENRNGVLVHTRVGSARGDLKRGLRWAGGELQLGLSKREIEGVGNRARALVDRVATGEIPTFR